MPTTALERIHLISRKTLIKIVGNPLHEEWHPDLSQESRKDLIGKTLVYPHPDLP